MLKKSGQHKALRPLSAWAGDLEEELEAARAHLAADEADKAERRAKAVSLIAKAARDVAELARADEDAPQEDDVDELRATLRARLAQYEDAERSSHVFGEPER